MHLTLPAQSQAGAGALTPPTGNPLQNTPAAPPAILDPSSRMMVQATHPTLLVKLHTAASAAAPSATVTLSPCGGVSIVDSAGSAR